MSDIFGIALTGLRAAQIGLSTTGHNISNANTPGYNRQQIVQAANPAQFSGAGFLGQGVSVTTVERVYSRFLDAQVQSAQTQSTYLDTYSAQISQIDNMLADPAAGLSPALQDFFKGVHDVAANPSSVPSRQSMVSFAEAMVTRFQTLNQRFEEIRDGVNSQITASVGLINGYAEQIAALNQDIVALRGSDQPPNDLLDQRDKLIADLNKEVNVTTVRQNDGSYNIFVGRGQALVVGEYAYKLSAAPSLEDATRVDVSYVSNGSVLTLPQDALNAGNLGGLLAFRGETLDRAQNELGRVAIGLAQSFNDQHRLGQDLDGNPGGYFFTVRGATGVPGQNAVPSAKVSANGTNNAASGVPDVTLTDIGALTASDYTLARTAGGFTLTRNSDKTVLFSNAALPQTVDGLTIVAPGVSSPGDNWLIQPTREGARDIGVVSGDPAKIAAAAPMRATAASANTGSGKIASGSVNPPPPPNVNLQQPLTITFTSPTTYDVSSPTSVPPIALVGVAYVPGANISYNGWTTQISGTPAAGDVFTVGANSGGVADNRNALLLAGLQTQTLFAGGTATYQSAYSQMVSSVGVQSRTMSVTALAQTSLLSQTQQTQQSLSGVNLDEEAANLLRYQQAYQASGKMMEIASTLFNALLSLGK